ncbi:LysR family transcriptional regulator [Cochlodiniinecator piscidefendens]|uniref:LysR family transcriptional regulator n=1 Tax=Cochlodiniinecator piscidefendens TaxID=2715756 RepID=UPI00140B723D|nr:LysR family transcriptional regulator [Cochlodiniinecator piscidefendens]
MHWDDLRIFLGVARSDSLSRAGKVLKIDPATVGRRISRLEEDLGAALFVKSPQGYALTGEGERLLIHATRAEQNFTLAMEDMRGEAGHLTGAIRIGAPDGSANYLLPQVCAKICDENPGLEVQIVALPRVFNLSKREADMAVTVSPPEAGRLLVQKVSDYHLHLAASEQYLSENPQIHSVSDLKDHRLIGYIPDMIFDKELDYLAAMKVDKVQLSSNSFSVQFNYVRQGAGVAIVHDFAIPSTTGVKRILMDDISLTRSFYLVRHADDRRVERLNRFANLLGQGIKAEVTRLEGLA